MARKKKKMGARKKGIVKKKVFKRSLTNQPTETAFAHHDKEGIHTLEQKKTAALLTSFREEAVILQKQKKKLDDLSRLIRLHFEEIEQNIMRLNTALKAKTGSKKTLAEVKNKVEKLQEKLTTIEKTRKNLVTQERRIFLQLHNLVHKKKIKGVHSLHSKAQLAKIEALLQYLLDEADYLLRQGKEIKTSHFQIMQELETKENKALSQLTRTLGELQKERTEVLHKKKMINADDQELQQKLWSLQKKQKRSQRRLS